MDFEHLDDGRDENVISASGYLVILLNENDDDDDEGALIEKKNVNVNDHEP